MMLELVSSGHFVKKVGLFRVVNLWLSFDILSCNNFNKLVLLSVLIHAHTKVVRICVMIVKMF